MSDPINTPEALPVLPTLTLVDKPFVPKVSANPWTPVGTCPSLTFRVSRAPFATSAGAGLPVTLPDPSGDGTQAYGTIFFDGFTPAELVSLYPVGAKATGSFTLSNRLETFRSRLTGLNVTEERWLLDQTVGTPVVVDPASFKAVVLRRSAKAEAIAQRRILAGLPAVPADEAIE